MSGQSRKNLQLSISARATKQWDRILYFYAKRNRSHTYSEKLAYRLDQLLEQICRFPELGQKTSKRGAHRRIFEKRFALFYRITDDSIEVTAIVDTRRNVKLE